MNVHEVRRQLRELRHSGATTAELRDAVGPIMAATADADRKADAERERTNGALVACPLPRARLKPGDPHTPDDMSMKWATSHIVRCGAMNSAGRFHCGETFGYISAGAVVLRAEMEYYTNLGYWRVDPAKVRPTRLATRTAMFQPRLILPPVPIMCPRCGAIQLITI